MCSVIFEVRLDSDGEYYHLVTAWRRDDTLLTRLTT